MDYDSEKVDTLANLLQEKIDDYSEKELALVEREEKCAQRELSIKHQISFIKAISESLSQELRDKIKLWLQY